MYEDAMEINLIIQYRKNKGIDDPKFKRIDDVEFTSLYRNKL